MFSYKTYDYQNLTSVYNKIIVPSKPKSIQAEAGDGYVELRWKITEDNKVKGYNIYRNGTLVDTVDASSTSYNDTSVENVNTYEFHITTKNRFTESDLSEKVTAEPTSKSTGNNDSSDDKNNTPGMTITGTLIVLLSTAYVYWYKIRDRKEGE